MTPKQFAAVVMFVCFTVPVAHADTVILKNGVELRNVKVVEEQEHTIKVNIIDYTNVVLGRGKVARIEKEGGVVVTAPPTADEPGATPVKVEPPAPQPKPVPMEQNVFRLPTNEQGKYVEILIALAEDGTTDVEVRPPSGKPGDKDGVYTVTAEGGKEIEFVVQRDDLGEASSLTVNTPAPPRTSPQDEFEHAVKDIDGKTLKINAKWDWNTRQLQDIQFLP